MTEFGAIRHSVSHTLFGSVIEIILINLVGNQLDPQFLL